MKVWNKKLNKKLNKKNKLMIFLAITLIILIILLISLTIAINTDHMNHSTIAKAKNLGINSLGSAYLEGPYGNINSSDKIAFIVGVHPLESNSHISLLSYLRNNSKNLNKSYYIYIINVTKDKDDFDKGRMNGQLLGRDYVVPDINSKNYTFVVDIHSHRDAYIESNFIISPLNDLESKKIGSSIIKSIEDMKILKYIPADDGHPTSPEYISIPILKNGTPNIIYETSLNEEKNVTDYFIKNFIENLDKVDFKKINFQ